MDMGNFEERDYKAFELFRKRWAIVAAGTPEDFNACTVGWGSLGTLWTRPGKTGSVVTVYLYPTRHTREYLAANDMFTVSFFPEECRKALGIMGSRSGRDGDKTAAAGLTPVGLGGSVTFEEAALTFVCRKIYQHRMSKEGMAPDIRDYYASKPGAFPATESGEWEPHWVFVGEIVDVAGELD